jgi:hypothetical protein
LRSFVLTKNESNEPNDPNERESRAAESGELLTVKVRYKERMVTRASS